MPGEKQHDVGRAYALVLTGCLERSVKYFEQQFDVYTASHKVSFPDGSGNNFSFDAAGIYRSPQHHCEVFIESKGYGSGGGLLGQYKEFVAKSYAISVMYERHHQDYFWFATNTPFGSSIGIRLTSPNYIQTILTTESTPPIRSILGPLTVDEGHVRRLSQLVSVGIFPDSFIRRMGIIYLVKPGENLWHIINSIHAYPEFSAFDPIASLVAELNRDQISSPDMIFPGQHLHLPWYGIDLGDEKEKDETEEVDEQTAAG